MESAILKKNVLPENGKKNCLKLKRKVLGINDIGRFQKMIEDSIKSIKNDHQDHIVTLKSGSGLANENNLSGNNFSFGSETQSINLSVKLAEHENQALRAYLNALNRIENGTFGLCTVCVAINHGDEKESDKIKNNKKNYIPIRRLELIPTAKYCYEHAK